jgi:hypothetical protein
MTDMLRKTDFETLLATLDEQQERKVDIVLPATAVCSSRGQIRVMRTDLEPTLTPDGVKSQVQVFEPTEVFDEGLVERLRNSGVGIPRAFLRSLREQGWTDMIDGTVNGLIHGKRGPGEGEWMRKPIDKSVMLRALKDADGGEVGTARALLSSSYKIVDHTETLRAAMRGMAAAGLGADNITQCDLTGRKMYVRVEAPEVKAMAPELLKNYRSPFRPELTGRELPLVHAGFVLTNSETGHGSFTVVPEITVEVCTNGMTITREAVSARHLGAKLDDGLIRYSERTRQANLELITSQAEDAIRTFLRADFVQSIVDEMTANAVGEVKEADKAVKEITQKIECPALYDDVLTMFIKGGDMSRGGLVHAVTAAAQSENIDADTAYSMQSKATALLLN